ncbi:recombinase family protein [Paenibacillus sp. URB8-2]|uniref:recombinase family protein n=1 Tax=Paenibacillus sp. URB8-2 TaxID=2741301 RepID=UPI0015B99690
MMEHKLVFNEYADAGVSGKSIKKRPALQNLLKDVKSRKVQEVWVWKTDGSVTPQAKSPKRESTEKVAVGCEQQPTATFLGFSLLFSPRIRENPPLIPWFAHSPASPSASHLQQWSSRWPGFA